MLLLTATLFVVLLLQRAQALCYNDTCLYEVKLAGAKASADCNSFELLDPTVTISTAHIITITVTGIETVWTPSISYSIWQSTTAPTISTLHGTGSQTSFQKTNSATITKREVMPRATQIIPTYASSCLNRGQYMSACSCIGIDLQEPIYWTTISTTTTTQVIPTATVTSAAVFTREVCSPANNYGFIYNSVQWVIPFNFSDPDALATFRYYTLDHYECCAACYGSGGPNGCYFYYMNLAVDGGICALAILDAVPPPGQILNTIGPPSPHCPNGISPAANMTPGNVAGAGPCLDGWLKTAY